MHPYGYWTLMRLCTLHNYYVPVWLPEADEIMHPAQLLCTRMATGSSRPRRINHRRQSWPPLMGRPPGYHWLSTPPPPPPGTRLAPSVFSPPLVTTSCPARLTLCSAPTTIGGPQPDSPNGVMRHCASTALGVLILWGNEPFLLAVDGSPAHGSLPTHTVWRPGAISSPHRDAL